MLTTPDGVWLTWDLPAFSTPECPDAPIHLYLHEAYLGPGTGIWDYYDGVRLLPIDQTALLLSPGKPEVGCAILWEGSDGSGVASPYWPVAHDPLWEPLPIECQPYNQRADGLSWEGM